MKLAWLTDIHLNFIDEDTRQKYYHQILNTHCDGVVISGDIAEAPSLLTVLGEMAENIKKPIYFVLGNHDYYNGQIDEVRAALIKFCKTKKQLIWLTISGIQQLNENTILLGQDGWADGRLGDYANSRVSLNDSRMIADLFQEKILGKFQLLAKMQQLADKDATQLRQDLTQAIEKHPKKIIVLTHIPPFKECCLHEGKVSDDNWLPYFSSKATGDVLMQVAQENPSINFLVLCGHTHTAAEFQALDNLRVKAGGAEYRQPAVQEIIGG